MGVVIFVAVLAATIPAGFFKPSSLGDITTNLNVDESPIGQEEDTDDRVAPDLLCPRSCKQTDNKRNRILGGLQYYPCSCGKDWIVPDYENWMASIKTYFYKKSKITPGKTFRKWKRCGGALISNQHILTALHCITDEYKNYALHPMNDVEIYFDRKRVEVFKGIMFKPLEYFYADMPNNPPNRINTIYKDDIAVIKLDRAINETDRLRKIPITTRLGIPAPKNYWMAGWGKTSNNPMKLAQFLQYTNQRDGIPCPASRTIFVTNMCFKNTNLVGTCPGDSGSPGVISIDGVWHLQGVHSRGHRVRGYRTGFCNETESISVDTDVYKYRTKIEQWTTQ